MLNPHFLMLNPQSSILNPKSQSVPRQQARGGEMTTTKVLKL